MTLLRFIGERRTQGKPGAPELEKQTGKYRESWLTEQRLSAETTVGTSARVGKTAL